MLTKCLRPVGEDDVIPLWSSMDPAPSHRPVDDTERHVVDVKKRQDTSTSRQKFGPKDIEQFHIDTFYECVCFRFTIKRHVSPVFSFLPQIFRDFCEPEEFCLLRNVRFNEHLEVFHVAANLTQSRSRLVVIPREQQYYIRVTNYLQDIH